MLSNGEPLRLGAQDAEDIAILSAILQDAVVLTNELRFDRLSGQFGVILQRFRWEAAPNIEAGPTRSNCRLSLTGVTGLASTDPCTSPPQQSLCADPALSLLTLTLDEAADETTGALTFTFAGQTRLRLLLQSGWQLRLEDFGEAWPCLPPAGHA